MLRPAQNHETQVCKRYETYMSHDFGHHETYRCIRSYSFLCLSYLSQLATRHEQEFSRGRKPTKLDQVKQAMRRDLEEGIDLDNMREKELAARYRVSREPRARHAVPSRCQSRQINSRRLATNDKLRHERRLADTRCRSEKRVDEDL
jgi:hypothetical protein